MQLPKEFEAVEENAKDSPVSNLKWYGKEDQTEEHSIHDRGKGDPVVLRLFEFKFRPDLEKLPVKEEILTADYMKYLHAQLWGDGMRMVMEPRVDISKEGCRIVVPAQAASGQSFLEEPKMLQEWITA